MAGKCYVSANRHFLLCHSTFSASFLSFPFLSFPFFSFLFFSFALLFFICFPFLFRASLHFTLLHSILFSSLHFTSLHLSKQNTGKKIKRLCKISKSEMFHFLSPPRPSNHLAGYIAMNKLVGFLCLFIITVLLGCPACSRRRLSQAHGRISKCRYETGFPGVELSKLG